MNVTCPSCGAVLGEHLCSAYAPYRQPDTVSCTGNTMTYPKEYYALEAAVARVRALHKAINDMDDDLACDQCSSECFYAPFPCPTIKALDGIA